MKRFISTLALGISFLTLMGCDVSPETKRAQTQFSAQNPSPICKMPDGRTLYFITVENPYLQSGYTHYVYFFGKDDTNTISVNYPVSMGKTTRNETIVLDGKTYQLVPLEQNH